MVWATERALNAASLSPTRGGGRQFKSIASGCCGAATEIASSLPQIHVGPVNTSFVARVPDLVRTVVAPSSARRQRASCGGPSAAKGTTSSGTLVTRLPACWATISTAISGDIGYSPTWPTGTPTAKISVPDIRGKRSLPDSTVNSVAQAETATLRDGPASSQNVTNHHGPTARRYGPGRFACGALNALRA